MNVVLVCSFQILKQNKTKSVGNSQYIIKIINARVKLQYVALEIISNDDYISTLFLFNFTRKFKKFNAQVHSNGTQIKLN